ncbi:MAG: 8-oxo-dGTP diphosphatase [Gammaproteobacteria bacterium]|nr:8-oxo-dGTP diphosphatase [Gammaproteobacteria bacterium]
MPHSSRATRKASGIEQIRTLADIDFSNWCPAEVATLTFVRRNDDVLLIHKLRGHGAGKVNAPGGKVDAGESPRIAAARETREEVGIMTADLSCRAELRFQDVDGTSMRGYVFVTRNFTGTPTATAEADPFWCAIAEIPYASMWADDVLWLPRVLSGECVVAEFLMRDDQVEAHRIVTVAEERLAELAQQTQGVAS